MKSLLIFLLCINVFIVGKSQPGTLDKSFGKGGWTYNTGPQMFIQSSALQADNKLVVGGANWAASQVTYRLVRYNSDGSLDNSFGDEGIANTVLSNYDYPTNGWSSIKVQPDGKIIAAGYAYVFNVDNYPPYDADIVMAKFNADGTPDESFGKNGVITTDFGEYETAEAMALQPDGRIVLTGIYSLYGIGYDSRVLTVRYNVDGSIDDSFGGKGYVVYTGPNTGAENAYAVVVQEDGRIVVGGDFLAGHYFILLRYLPDGEPDKTFGTNGYVSTKIDESGADSDESINSLALDKEGRIIAAGTCLNIAMSVARYKPDGTLDNSFNKTGKKIIPINAYAEAKRVLLLKDERILLTGNASANLALVCLKPDGSFDSSFGTNGETVTDFGGQETCNDALVQTDGKILLTGDYEQSSTGYSLIARYNGYDPGKQPLMVRIKRWMLHHGISWQMQPNKDVRYYSVQRSADGIIYKEIAKLSNKQQVDKYEDAAMLAGSSYYRLTAIGWDGSRTYSNTVLVDDNAQVKVFPNPVRDNLQLQGLQSGKTSVSIVDLQGNVRSSSVAGGANYSINTSQLTPGNYLLKLQHNSTTTTQPFVKE